MLEKEINELLGSDKKVGFAKLEEMNFKDELGHPLVNCEEYIYSKEVYKQLIDIIKICIEKFGKNSINSELLQIIVDLAEKML